MNSEINSFHIIQTKVLDENRYVDVYQQNGITKTQLMEKSHIDKDGIAFFKMIKTQYGNCLEAFSV